MDALRETVQRLGWPDFVILGLLAVFLVIGLAKGFVWQLARLVTVVGGCVVASRYGPALAPHLRSLFPRLTEPADRYLAYFVTFGAVAGVVLLAAHILRNLIQKLELRSYDRLLGGVVGLVTACILILLVLTGLSAAAEQNTLLTQAGLEELAQGSLLLPYVYRSFDAFALLFPGELREVMHRFVEPARHLTGEEEPPAETDQ